jgi:cytochrome bd-type quinol oxidase subunit 1
VAYQAAQGLRTEDAVSPVLSAGQVRASIALFGLIYALLLAVWIFVLNDKIRRGPEAPEGSAEREAGFLAAAVRRGRHQDSLTRTGGGG